MTSFMVAHCRPRNLRDILVHSKLSSDPVSSGTYKCRKCIICKYVQEGPHFYDSQRNQKHRTSGYINCPTDYVIYAIQCKNCNVQYVGQTSKNIKTMIYQHIRDIINHTSTTVASHFNSPGHSLNDVSTFGITIAPRNASQHLITEKAWIITLKTMLPWGLNIQSQWCHKRHILWQHALVLCSTT